MTWYLRIAGFVFSLMYPVGNLPMIALFFDLDLDRSVTEAGYESVECPGAE